MLKQLVELIAGSNMGTSPAQSPKAPMVVDEESGRHQFGEWHSAQEHAHRLYNWLLENRYVDGSILSGDLMKLHFLMMREMNWMERKWPRVAREYALLTSGGRKLYAHVDGRRLRIHALPESGDCLP